MLPREAGAGEAEPSRRTTSSPFRFPDGDVGVRRNDEARTTRKPWTKPTTKRATVLKLSGKSSGLALKIGLLALVLPFIVLQSI